MIPSLTSGGLKARETEETPGMARRRSCNWIEVGPGCSRCIPVSAQAGVDREYLLVSKTGIGVDRVQGRSHDSPARMSRTQLAATWAQITNW